MWRPCKPSGICATPRAFTRTSPWTNIQAFPNRITLLYNVLPQGRDINDIHVIKSNAGLISTRMNGREHGPCPVALSKPHSSSTAVKCNAPVSNLEALQLYGSAYPSLNHVHPDIPHIWTQATTLTHLDFCGIQVMSLSELQTLPMLKSLKFSA